MPPQGFSFQISKEVNYGLLLIYSKIIKILELQLASPKHLIRKESLALIIAYNKSDNNRSISLDGNHNFTSPAQTEM